MCCRAWALLALCLAGSAAAAPLTAEQARADLRELADLIEASHPDPFHAVGRLGFWRRVDEALRAVPAEGLSVPALRALAQPIVAAVADGHTTLAEPEVQAGPRLWITLSPVEGRLAVTAVHDPGHRALLGATLVRYAGVDLPALRARLDRSRGTDNAIGRDVALATALRCQACAAALLGRPVQAEVAMVFEGADGAARTETLPFLSEAPGPPLAGPSRLRLPAANAAGLGWGFLDDARHTAYLRVDTAMRYREAFEVWQATGKTALLGAHLATVAREAGCDPLPETVAARIACVPSATETFSALFQAMVQAGTRRLVVDLRRNGGGNSAVGFLLTWFLAPFDRWAHVALHTGYQIPRYSALYFRTYTARSPDGLAARGLRLGDLDFQAARDWARRQTPEPAAARAELGRWMAMMPSFAPLFRAGTHSGRWQGEMWVLTAPTTYSAGFEAAVLLRRLGARIAGRPSAQAGNCFIDGLPFQLTHSKLRGGISSKRHVTFPDDPARGRVLTPDRPLGLAAWRAQGMAPDAAVRLVLPAGPHPR